MIEQEAQLAFRLERDYATAERLYRRAIEFNPAFAGSYALLMLISGLTEEAEAALAMLTESYPQIAPWWTFLAQSRAINGDFQGAYDAAVRYENLNPPDTYSIWQLPRFLVLVPMGRMEEAQQRLDALGDAMTGRERETVDLFRSLLAFQIDMAAGNIEGATAVAEAMRDAHRPDRAGHLFFALGDPRAGEELARASRFMDPAYLGLGFMLLSPGQRDADVYRCFLDAMGLTSEWRLELCRRAATMPRKSFISCDPHKYESRAVSSGTASLGQADPESGLERSRHGIALGPGL